MRGSKLYTTGVLFCLGLVFACCQVLADEQRHHFLAFASADSKNTFDESIEEVEEDRLRLVLDGIYSYSGDRFRFLAEYLWSTDESEMERMQLGWRLGDSAMLWFGRFHSPSNYWSTEFHHGQFMQTSITRPSVDEWEDESGPVPSHVTGMLLEVNRPVGGDAQLDIAVSLGLAPRFEVDRLEPFDVLDPGSGHDPSLMLRMAYTPKVLESTQFGFAYAANDINVATGSAPALADLDSIGQQTLSVFADWRFRGFGLLANVVAVENTLRLTNADVDDEFVLGYVQAHYELSDRWTAFGRADLSFGEDNSPYLRLLPAFLSHRNLLGLRWDFAQFHSLTAELGEISQQGADLEHDTFKELRLQWSAAFD